MPTIEERLALVESSLAEVKTKTDLIVRVQSEDDGVHGSVPGLKFLCRIGILTDFWMLKVFGKGAALSVGAFDRFAGYFENDQVNCPDNPTVAVYASSVTPNPYGQPNHAFEGVVGNSAMNRGLVVSIGDLVFILRTEGFELLNSWAAFWIGKVGGAAKQLWP